MTQQMEKTEHHEEVIPKDLPRLDRRKIMLVLGAAVLFFVALFLIGFIPHVIHQHRLVAEAEAMASEPPVVGVVQPKFMDETTNLTLPGTARPMQETAIFARTTGYLKSWTNDIGSHVTAGQLLAVLDAPDVDAQLAEAQAALQQAKANVVSAQNNYDLTQATYTRYKGLVATGGVTQQDLDTRQTAFSLASAARDAADASVKSAEATVQRLQAAQDWEKIYAPFDGTVTARNYDIGALISANNTAAGQEMFRISQTDPLRVFVNVPQSYVTLIRVGQHVTFRAPNYPGRDFDGVVARWAGALDPNSRTMLTELHFDNHDGALWPGMYGEANFQIHRDHPPMTVPSTALMFEADGTQLALVKDGKIRFQPVQVGRDFGSEIEILIGLQGDEQVVSNPGEKLADGLDVKTVASGGMSGPSRTKPAANSSNPPGQVAASAASAGAGIDPVGGAGK
jgi:membrane fusion protein, multidrug efflux system